MFCQLAGMGEVYDKAITDLYPYTLPVSLLVDPEKRFLNRLWSSCGERRDERLQVIHEREFEKY